MITPTHKVDNVRFARQIDNHLYVWDDDAEDWILSRLEFEVDMCVWDFKFATFDFCKGTVKFELGPFELSNEPDDEEDG